MNGTNSSTTISASSTTSGSSAPTASEQVEAGDSNADWQNTNDPLHPWSKVILTDELSVDQKQKYLSMCHEFPELPKSRHFNNISEMPLPPFNIKLNTDMPINVPNRQHPLHLQEVIQSAVKDMLEAEVIEPSSSPYSFPMVIVPKPGGTWRPCIDYRRLNLVTIKDVYPLPRIDEMLDALNGARYFTCVDLKSGYWQIPLDPQDKEKTAFSVRRGHYQFRVMPFGLSNAPAHFQRIMDRISLFGRCHHFQ
jgi:hypothetical protein